MPVIIPEGLEEIWMSPTDNVALRALAPLLNSWDSNGWISEPCKKQTSFNMQMELF